MKSLFEFCVENDPAPPSFVRDLIDEGIVRSNMADEPEKKLTEQEKQFLLQRRRSYYGQEWIKTILKIVPFKKPQFALLEQLTSLTLLQEMRTDETNKMYVHFAFVKPGRHVFCIKAPPLAAATTGAQKRSKVYAHRILVNPRQEEIPKCKSI